MLIRWRAAVALHPNREYTTCSDTITNLPYVCDQYGNCYSTTIDVANNQAPGGFAINLPLPSDPVAVNWRLVPGS
jgi:hypothetical protein